VLVVSFFKNIFRSPKLFPFPAPFSLSPVVPPLFRSLAQKNHLHRLKNHSQIQRDRKVLDIEKIELQLALGIFYAGSIAVLDLRPSCQSGTNGVPLGEERQAGLEQIAEVRLLGPWTHQTHLSAQYVEKLR